MKSPVPTSFVLLLLVLGAAAAVIGLTVALVLGAQTLQTSAPAMRDASRGFGIVVGLILLGILVHSFLGVLAGVRYRQDRKTLNRIGLSGNALLLLALLALFGFSYWQGRQARVSRQLRGPIEIAEDYD